MSLLICESNSQPQEELLLQSFVVSSMSFDDDFDTDDLDDDFDDDFDEDFEDDFDDDFEDDFIDDEDADLNDVDGFDEEEEEEDDGFT